MISKKRLNYLPFLYELITNHHLVNHQHQIL